ncbi:hypothetical protein EPUL_000750, partial [Erysiphe pulchra]
MLNPEGEIMAPPLGSKRELPSDSLDTGSRVSKPTTTTYRPSHITRAKALISITNSNCSTRSNLIENVLSEAHGSTSKLDDDTGMEDETESIISTEEFPLLRKESAIEIKISIASPISHGDDDKKNGTAPLMAAIKGLLDLTNDYLQKLEERHPGIGADFLAMLADTDSRAMRAPQGKSKEDRRVMIRLGPEHKARKAGVFELRQKIKELVSENPLLERQEKWTTFIIGPIPKRVRCLDGMQDPIEGLLQEELATNDKPHGNILICVPEAKANKFPSRLRIFGEVVSIQRIRQRQQVL